jgi:hypothetical protein
MRAYQAFELDEVGHVSGCIDLFCEDDDDARSQSQQIASERDIELWQAERRITLIAASRGTALPSLSKRRRMRR